MPRQDIVVFVVIAIQAFWRAFVAQKQFLHMGGKVKHCRLLNRRMAEVKKAREEAAVLKIASCMRRYICRKTYYNAIRGALMCYGIYVKW
jgi:hypothetical protein